MLLMTFMLPCYNYNNLSCKFNFLNREHDQIKSKIEIIKNESNDFLVEMEQSVSWAIPISKVDASSLYIGLNDESCSSPTMRKIH
jgi:hypothetical protein